MRVSSACSAFGSFACVHFSLHRDDLLRHRDRDSGRTHRVIFTPLLRLLAQITKLSQYALPVPAEQIIDAWVLAQGPQRSRTVVERRNDHVAPLIEENQVVHADHQPLDTHHGYKAFDLAIRRWFTL